MDNRVIDILKTVILQYGDRILTDSKRCRALLQDHCAGAYAREVKLLLLALEEGVVTDLRTPPIGLPATLLGARLVDRLITERYLDEMAAEWTVHAWGEALGISLPTVASAPLPFSVPGVVLRTLEQRAIPHTPTNTLTGQQASLGIELITIPAGDFLYGEEKERKHLPAFTMTKYPITVAQYRQFCAATNRAMPEAPSWDWQENHPIVNVSWDDAAVFAAWAGLALPTEEEWEKAARGTDGREYPWGNQWDAAKCCNSAGQLAYQSAPVGKYTAGASPYEVQDMAGNVWEWCDSWYQANSTRVLRGGSWRSLSPEYLRAPYRSGLNSGRGYHDHGFRCVFRSPGR